MTPTDPMLPFWFLACALFSAALTAVILNIYWTGRFRNLEKLTWAAARRYYTHLFSAINE